MTNPRIHFLPCLGNERGVGFLSSLITNEILATELLPGSYIAHIQEG